MTLICSIPQNIEKNSTIVLPISMNQSLERGERLEAILNAIELSGYKKRTTILICDYLNRYNLSSESAAFEQGIQFIQEHSVMLSGFNILHWKNFIDCIDLVEFEAQKNKILNASLVGSKFHNKMKKTWEKCLSAHQSLENSILYQTEEYAAILCMSKFDHLFYPKKMNSGLSYLYGFVEGVKPHYHYIKISESKDESFFTGESRTQQNNTHIHIAFRGLLYQIETLLFSSELSDSSKKNFAEEVENLLIQQGLLYGGKKKVISEFNA